MARGIAFRGYRTDARTAAMVEEAEKLGGPLTITQGSYNAGVGASKGTHDQGGVLDFRARGLTRTQINRRVRALRRVGFAAWHRPYIEGVWPEHIHAVAVGCEDLAPIAARQVASLRRGRNGLRGDGLDPHRGMNLPVITWERYLEQRDKTVDLSDAVRRVKRTGEFVGLVAKALKAEGLTADKAGYARWQHRIGFRGADADGVPGMSSLRQLGRGHGFEVQA